MTTTYRNSNVATLTNLAVALTAKGFSTGPVVIPENPWVDGNPYISTSATNRDILQTLKEVR
jgi:hypothetical protein